MNWYIGQEVVCVRTHSTGVVVKGKVYTVKGLCLSPCGCDRVLIDVGATHIKGTYCSECMGNINDGPIHWISETRFAPLMDITELKEILNEETVTK